MAFTSQIDISDQSERATILSALPAYKNQLDDSNNQHLLSVIADLIASCQNNLLSLTTLMKINNASGQNLTDLGLDFGVHRFDSDDEFLRFEIKWQLLKANTKMDMSSIKTLISVLLSIDVHSFDIIKTGKPHEIELVNIPFNFSSGSHSEQKRQILADDLQSVLPAETNLKDIQYEQDTDGEIYYAFATNHAVYNESEVLVYGNI